MRRYPLFSAAKPRRAAKSAPALPRARRRSMRAPCAARIDHGLSDAARVWTIPWERSVALSQPCAARLFAARACPLQCRGVEPNCDSRAFGDTPRKTSAETCDRSPSLAAAHIRSPSCLLDMLTLTTPRRRSGGSCVGPRWVVPPRCHTIPPALSMQAADWTLVAVLAVPHALYAFIWWLPKVRARSPWLVRC